MLGKMQFQLQKLIDKYVSSSSITTTTTLKLQQSLYAFLILFSLCNFSALILPRQLTFPRILFSMNFELLRYLLSNPISISSIRIWTLIHQQSLTSFTLLYLLPYITTLFNSLTLLPVKTIISIILFHPNKIRCFFFSHKC